MSALPPIADIGTQSWNVRFVPKADIGLKNLCVGISFPRYGQKRCAASCSVVSRPSRRQLVDDVRQLLPKGGPVFGLVRR